jgi:hypothetical protein
MFGNYNLANANILNFRRCTGPKNKVKLWFITDLVGKFVVIIELFSLARTAGRLRSKCINI